MRPPCHLPALPVRRGGTRWDSAVATAVARIRIRNWRSSWSWPIRIASRCHSSMIEPTGASPGGGGPRMARKAIEGSAVTRSSIRPWSMVRPGRSGSPPALIASGVPQEGLEMFEMVGPLPIPRDADRKCRPKCPGSPGPDPSQDHGVGESEPARLAPRREDQVPPITFRGGAPMPLPVVLVRMSPRLASRPGITFICSSSMPNDTRRPSRIARRHENPASDRPETEGDEEEDVEDDIDPAQVPADQAFHRRRGRLTGRVGVGVEREQGDEGQAQGGDAVSELTLAVGHSRSPEFEGACACEDNATKEKLSLRLGCPSIVGAQKVGSPRSGWIQTCNEPNSGLLWKAGPVAGLPHVGVKAVAVRPQHIEFSCNVQISAHDFVSCCFTTFYSEAKRNMFWPESCVTSGTSKVSHARNPR